MDKHALHAAVKKGDFPTELNFSNTDYSNGKFQIAGHRQLLNAPGRKDIAPFHSGRVV